MSAHPATPADAIAVVGLSCRLPGARDAAEFWALLRDGRSAIGEPPEERKDVGASARAGGFLDRVDGFDAAFFGVSRREAAAMDPQQRLLLELGWEALEDAGQVPDTLRAGRTGVFVGAMWDDYALLRARHGAPTLGPFSLAGVQRGVIANRLSYVLGGQGPSLTVDTGQSSSLAAVHLACASLRSGESTVALAGGVNLMLAPETTAITEQFGALSPDGRCFTFDARANGYVRGEGGGMVVLKPLDRALADGDRVYCVIRGSALNNDGAGRTLTTPDAAAQSAVLRRACELAGVRPADVQYLELHGTGTRVGDPVEAAALGAVHGADRGDGDPALLVGSAKTNIGHLEGAAGIAGLLKTVLSVYHATVPASLNFTEPNPGIDFAAWRLRVAEATEPWPGPDGAERFAGVSSFGAGGTNCHVVVSSAPDSRAVVEPPRNADQDTAPSPVVPGRVVPWIISGASAAGLRAQAARLAAADVAGGAADPLDVAAALVRTRTVFGHRAVVL